MWMDGYINRNSHNPFDPGVHYKSISVSVYCQSTPRTDNMEYTTSQWLLLNIFVCQFCLLSQTRRIYMSLLSSPSAESGDVRFLSSTKSVGCGREFARRNSCRLWIFAQVAKWSTRPFVAHTQWRHSTCPHCGSAHTTVDSVQTINFFDCSDVLPIYIHIHNNVIFSLFTTHSIQLNRYMRTDILSLSLSLSRIEHSKQQMKRNGNDKNDVPKHKIRNGFVLNGPQTHS